jgi:hypothetical protein
VKKCSENSPNDDLTKASELECDAHVQIEAAETEETTSHSRSIVKNGEFQFRNVSVMFTSERHRFHRPKTLDSSPFAKSAV